MRFSAQEIPKDAFSDMPFQKKGPEDAREERPRDKIHPVLEAEITERPGDETALLVITSRDDVPWRQAHA